MDNLRSVLSIVLSKIPSREILNEKVQYDNITEENFVKLAGYYVKNYSNDELENLFYYIQNEYEEQADYVRGYERGTSGHRGSFSIFDAILLFAVRVLQEIDGEPVCQYEHMLRWRMTSHELDEDVFTTAYLAYKDIRYINVNRKFSWRPVIRHNNIHLNRLLSQGMADNHFHLKGSAPQFPLSWISMMNDVVKKNFRTLLEEYEERRLSTTYNTGSGEEKLYVSYLKAALIRCFLFAKLTNRIFLLQDEESDELVEFLLQDETEILFYRTQLQRNISLYRNLEFGECSVLDYAQSGNYHHVTGYDEVNEVLSGERWFMYSMFQKIYSKNQKLKKYFNLFYAYLVIKENIRSELVQTNDNMGFDNFARYQDRKEDFIEGTPFEESYVKMAVKGTILNQNIIHLEARIAPKNSAEENRDYIRKFERMLGNDEELQKRYFYVFHFIKEKDNKKNLQSDIMCRHFEKRKSLRKQAQAIAELREKYPKEAKRLKGIDACAKEIGCRPEVFAQTYRYLRNHIVYPKENFGENSDNEGLEQLHLTYHIGEDCLDIIDGLRAIDEMIRFLQMDCGSRIGHALALGIDVEEYYQVKNRKILIGQQDYLDNLVWLYYKIKKFKLNGYEDVTLFIEQEYSKYFRLIYGNHVCDGTFQETIKAAREHFKKDNEVIVEGYCNSNFHFRISEYYAAWKLRGDNPEYYINGYFKEHEDISEWNRYAVNRQEPTDYQIRYNPECAYLYYLYHYCGEAKKEGEKVIEIRADYRLIQCVKEVQHEMKKWIGKLGIGIETNPSSNYLIGPFKRYDKHPIFGFYNLGLVTSQNELENCPQLPVCINTDDQGIFSTYLENEYAMLALALEKAKDENGNNKYNRTMIYQWIDNVRKMGLEFSFAEDRG
ncbi:MAG: hypothetical protein J6K53_11770 [Roseburia sp.]|nr:hypothetical protein [Roseburia sp.]